LSLRILQEIFKNVVGILILLRGVHLTVLIPLSFPTLSIPSITSVIYFHIVLLIVMSAGLCDVTDSGRSVIRVVDVRS